METTGSRFCTILEGVINKSLARELQSVISFQKLTAKGNEKKEFDTNGFGHIWNLQASSLYLWERSPAGYTRSQTHDHFKSVFYAFYNSIAFLQQAAPSCLDESLVGQDHPAQSSLFVAFARLYRNTLSSINNFTGRHFDFYYKNILNVTPRGLRPDHVHLLFAPQLPGDEVLLPAGTGFLAGKDLSNTDLVYVSERDVLLNSATIKILRTLYLEKNRLISPASELGFITKAKATEIPVPAKAVSESDKALTSWPLFGAPGPGNPGNNQSRNSDVGFALASNVLLLKEGTRQVRCALTFTKESFDEFTNSIRLLAQSTGRTSAEVFERSFQEGFRIYLSTESGWYNITPQDIDCRTVNPGAAENTIEFYFRLESDDPAVIPYRQEIHGGAMDTRLPVLKFLCNPDSFLYLYSLVSSLVIKSVRFNIDVKGVSNLTLYNKHGKLNPGQAIQPFGTAPAPGSWLIMGSYEIRSKKVNKLSIAIEWADLPLLHGGFETYYREYGPDIGNDSFRVQTAALEKGAWVQPENRKNQEYSLFSYDEYSGLLGKDKILDDIWVPPVKQPDFLQNEGEFRFDNNTQAGFIKLTLSGPAMGFGFGEYQQLISSTIMTNVKKKVPLALPNMPYNPTISKISINYSATAEITAYHSKSTKFDKFHPTIYHLHPWGFDIIFPSRKGRTDFLFPRCEEEGNLYIGIADFTPPASITLFFHMKIDAVNSSRVLIPPPKWFYLQNNEWRQLKKHEIISDSTNNFLNPGIITLSIPAMEELEVTTIFPEQLTWLKVSLESNPGAVCTVYDIRTQVAEAIWVNNNNTFEHLKTALPPGSIRKTKNPVAGVREIVQPMSSFGGMLAEDQGQVYRRISERMKHKNRTGSAYDYEQLVLQRFPEIMKVKCFPNIDPENSIRPGNILVAVIPRAGSRIKNGSGGEPLANSNLLNKIKSFLESCSSPFATIEVCNPVYEKIKVQCSVKFTRGVEGGYFLEMLNRELIDRLSPWGKFEEDRPRFGETIRCADILSFIQNRPYISFATGFSILQVTEDRKGFASVVDTVTWTEEDGDEPVLKWELAPTFPSSILVSAERHSIDVIPAEKSIRPLPTGIDKLELDETFIIR
jgi:hypothetical protein